MSWETIRISFAESKLPKFKENKSKGVTTYGEKNDFPDSLLELYKRSPKHGAIVKQKARFVAGEDVVIEGNAQAEKLKEYVNPYEGLQEIKAKLSLDYELFNGFAFEVHYNKLGEIAKLYHVDFSRVRTLDHSKYFYSLDWQKAKTEDIREYLPFNPNSVAEFEVQMFYYREYDAGLGVYPLPPYIHALQYIEIDVEIANFHNNNIRNGFSNGTLIQLFKGEPSDDVAREFERKFKSKTTGTDNAGGVLIQFNEGNERPAEVTHIQPSDIDEQFLMLNNTVQQEIFVAHSVTSPMLFGIRVEGQLGGRSELIEAYEIFHKSYINNRQQKLNRCLQYVLETVYVGLILKTKDSEFIGLDYVELFNSGLVDRNEARLALGFEAPTPVQQFNEVEFKRWNDNDIEVFAQFGIDESSCEFMEFADLTKDEAKVMAVVSDNEKVSIKEISEATKIGEDEALKILKKLQDDGKIVWTNNAIKITDIGKQEIQGVDKIELFYKYQEQPDAPELKGESRPFCVKLLQLKRLYSRADIDQMTQILGYDVWKRRGGWYTVPDSEPALHVPQCRHFWKQVIVRRKA